jgi:Clp amino terminal domain, pathogenicity island component
MYERFTDRARKAMKLANNEARRFNHEYIGTEHILLGLIKEGSGVAAIVLEKLNMDLRHIRLEVEKIVQAGPNTVTWGKLLQTPKAKKVIEYAIDEARQLGQDWVGTEHILLGLVREEYGVAAQILMNLGLSLPQVRDEVLSCAELPACEKPTVIAGVLFRLGLGVGTVRNYFHKCLGKKSDKAPMNERPPKEPVTLPPAVSAASKNLDQVIELLNMLKEKAVVEQDFEWAASLRDQADALCVARSFLINESDRIAKDYGELDGETPS